MRRLPMTRICSIVCEPWAVAATVAIASSMHASTLSQRTEIPLLRTMEARFLFTGLDSRGEHTFWCGPISNFTGRICTPSLLKIWYCYAERLIILDRGHRAQTCGRMKPGAKSYLSPISALMLGCTQDAISPVRPASPLQRLKLGLRMGLADT